MADQHFTNKPVWQTKEHKKEFPSLNNDLRVDVAIVGGGITGITAAYELSKAGKKVVVLEAREVGKGTSGTSTGNLYVSIGEHLFSIKEKHSEETLQKVAQSRQMAIDYIQARIKEYSIECEFKRVPFHLFTTQSSKSQSNIIQKEQKAAQQAGFGIKTSSSPQFPYQVDEIMTLENQAQFNPLSYVKRLAVATESENCLIYENTQVLDVEDGEPCIIKTDKATVTADQVIMATHSPKGIYGVHTVMKPVREHVLAVKLKVKIPENGIYWHVIEDQHYSIRPYSVENEHFLLVLGEPYKVGHKNDTENSFKTIEKYVRTHFEVEEIAYSWAAQNYQPADILPFIGNSPLQDNVYIATGFAADGLIYGTLAASILKDCILGIKNPLIEIYSPKRFTPVASASDFIKDNADVAFNLLNDYLFYGKADALKEIKPGEGKTIKLNNERLAVYKNPDGELAIVSGICPHMGCIVHWNNGEKSWDCPCHGSRFATDGSLLEGPSYHGLAKPKKS